MPFDMEVTGKSIVVLWPQMKNAHDEHLPHNIAFYICKPDITQKMCTAFPGTVMYVPPYSPGNRKQHQWNNLFEQILTACTHYHEKMAKYKENSKGIFRRVFCLPVIFGALAFRSSDSQSLHQGYTRQSRLSTMFALKRRKPFANKSNKPTAPHPPRRYGNNHTLEVLHDGIGVDHLRALCQKPRGKTAYDITTLRKKRQQCWPRHSAK